MQSKVPQSGREIATEPLVLSQPQQGVDPLRRPFVGNETIEDNLRENVKVAAWNVMGDRERGLDIAVAAGVATLSGPVADTAEAAEVVKAALSISGIGDVVDRLVPAGSGVQPGVRAASAIPAAHPVLGTKMVALTRFCGLDDASTGAAIRQAVGRLDHFFAERKLPPPTQLVIVYRNLIPGAITLELGVPVPDGREPRLEGEFSIAALPAVAEQVAMASSGIAPIVSTLRDLMRVGHAYAWQVLEADEFRPWRGHNALPLNVGQDS